MPDYTKTVIYKIVNNVDDQIYVGSTTRPLYQRWYNHKLTAKKYPMRKVYSHCAAVGWNRCRIVQIEKFRECQDVQDQKYREQHWIDQLHPTLNSADAWANCEHGRQKSQCKECGGRGICQHGRIRATCKPCGGSQVCQHGRQKPQCKPCGGKRICQHQRQKDGCKQCNGDRYKCHLCDKTLSSKLALQKHNDSKKHQFMKKMFEGAE